MKRLEIVQNKLNGLYSKLFDEKVNDDTTREGIKKYEAEKRQILKKDYDKAIKEIPYLTVNETYAKLKTGNIEFDYLFLELLCKNPSIIEDNELLMAIVNFINSGNQIANLKALLNLNNRVFLDRDILTKIDAKNFDKKKGVLESLILMRNSIFREYFAEKAMDDNKSYTDISIMEKALTEGLDLDFILALGNEEERDNYFKNNYSIELLNMINKAKTKSLKKLLLSKLYHCESESILNILVKFFEVDEIREQLLIEDSFYYKLLIEPLKVNCDKQTYGALDTVLNNCSRDFSKYILDCDNPDKLAHAFDLIAGPYIYYFRERRLRRVPVCKFSESFKEHIDSFNKTVEFLASNGCQRDLVLEYEDDLNDDLRNIATESLINNEDKTLTEEEKDKWNDYIVTIYGNINIKDDKQDDCMGLFCGIYYGLDSISDDQQKVYSYNL